jgi:hypothetical protein
MATGARFRSSLGHGSKIGASKMPPRAKNWLIGHYRLVARALAWIGIFAIIVLSVVPAVDRRRRAPTQLNRNAITQLACNLRRTVTSPRDDAARPA